MTDNILLGETRDFKFPTVAPSTGVPATLDGSPVVSAYPNNGTTQVTAGITLSVDFDSVTGMHNVNVAATAANGYDYGVKYTLVVTTGTVDSVSAVGYTIGEFYIYPSIIPEFGILDYGTAQSATSTTLVLRSALAIPDDEMIGSTVLITSATAGARGRRIITDWDSATDTATVDTWVTTPTGTISYVIYGSPVGSAALPADANLTQLLGTAPTETTGGRLAGNFSVFYDNADADTTQTVDDVGGGSSLTLADIADAVWDEVLTAGSHNIVNSAGRRLRQLETGSVIHADDTQAGSTADIVILANAASNQDDFYQHQSFVIDGETRIILNYVGSTRAATLDKALVNGAPSNNTPYEVLALGPSFAVAVGGSYADDAVHIAPSGSTTAIIDRDGLNTQPIDDGEPTNARTIADAKNLKAYYMVPGCSFTLNANHDNWVITGNGSLITMGGQSVLGSLITKALLTGTSAAGSGRTVIQNLIASGCTFQNEFTGTDVQFVGTTTLNSTDTFSFTDATFRGASSILLFSNASARFEVRNFAGDVDIQGMVTGNELELMGDGLVNIDSGVTGGDLVISGDIKPTGSTGNLDSITYATIGDIEAKTDQLTFTKANELDSNIKSVIDDTVQESGATDTDWGGAP